STTRWLEVEPFETPCGADNPPDHRSAERRLGNGSRRRENAVATFGTWLWAAAVGRSGERMPPPLSDPAPDRLRSGFEIAPHHCVRSATVDFESRLAMWYRDASEPGQELVESI